MIIENELVLAEGWDHSVWGNAGTYYGEQIIDLTKTKTQMGKPLFLVVKMSEAAATGTSVNFKLVGSTAEWTAADGTGGTFTVIGESGAILTASLTLNANVWVFRLPEKISQRYLGLAVTSAESTDFTTGKIDAYLTDEPTLAAY